MSTPLSPPAAVALAPSAAPRQVTLAAPVETARAVRPVQPDTATDRVRNALGDERPVGPPPAFEVNVLDALHERLRSAPPPDAGAAPFGPESGPAEHAFAHASPEDGHVLDKKI